MNGKIDDTSFESLANHFLVAMPGLHDPNFSHSIIYICDHSSEGAMGLVINNPLEIPLSQIFEQFEIDYSPRMGDEPLMSGGPVQIDRGFVLHRSGQRSWEATLPISSDISLTSSRDIISSIAEEQGPSDMLVTLGYAGWGPGQLEEELANNAWLTVPGDADIIFKVPCEQRANAAAAKIGIDLNLLSSNAGHA
ncbi:MAG: YqgE/AlgH family protein [Gammaproteobacteria bacterium]|nr:MAG: YqgE/AlgH family protein [Gammaproteobacteria bacterium]